RPQEALLTVAEGLGLVGFALAEPDRNEQERLVRRIGERVRGLREQGRRPAEQATRELRHRDRGVRRQRDQDGLPARAGVTVAAQAPVADLPRPPAGTLSLWRIHDATPMPSVRAGTRRGPSPAAW